MLPATLEQDQKLPSPDGPTGVLETNRYFYTERFRPLISELEEEEEDGEVSKVAQAHAGGAHDHKHHHAARNAILPGVFFIYDIYPFAVEITSPKIPFTHLLIRIMATFGGVFTIVKWADAALYSRDRKRGKHY
jgi:hypothetical protein